MPAFSAFAGAVAVKRNDDDRIIAVAENTLIEVTSKQTTR